MLKFNLNSELEKPSKERLDYLRKQVKYLETLPQHEQRSPEWFQFREGLLTASDWGTVLGNNKYSKPDKVLNKTLLFFSSPLNLNLLITF